MIFQLLITEYFIVKLKHEKYTEKGAPIVLKDGLAAGKGVAVAMTIKMHLKHWMIC